MLLAALGGYQLSKPTGNSETLPPDCNSIEHDRSGKGFSPLPSGGPTTEPVHSPSVVRTPQKDHPIESDLESTKKRVEKLDQELSKQNIQLNQLAIKTYGQIVPWSENTPQKHRPEEFQNIVSRTIDECELPLELIGFDCHEPPCLAVMRILSPELNILNTCPVWNNTYGDKINQRHATMDCGDGRTERAAIVRSIWTDAAAADPFNNAKRIEQRQKAIISGWQCLPP